MPDILSDIRKTERLSVGDPCEFRYPASDQWRSGTVLTNGGPSYWTVVDTETSTELRGLYIEHVRAVGTDPWED